MNPKALFAILSLCFLSAIVAAQNKNPFQSIGKNGKVLTLSNGRYDEIIEKDSLERVGSVIVNRYTRKIEKFLNEDSLYKTNFTKEQSRFLSIDPLAAKFPYYSPYQFAGNMPIWANDLDGLEPNFRHKGNGINGVGLFDPSQLSSIQRHSTVLTIGKEGKQFQIQFLMHNGQTIGYLASRIVPEEEYKRLYGGSGTGLQEAYVIEMDKFFEFGRNSDKYYDYSQNAELDDFMYGQIERDPVKRLFDPRSWLMGRVIGTTGNMASKLLGTTTLLETAASTIVARGISGRGFTGSQLSSVLKSTEDDMITLYRGVSGSEQGTGALFLAETEEYARSYGSNVVKYQISRSGFKQLRNEGLIEELKGVNSKTGATGTEFKVSNQAIKQEILKTQQ